MTKLKSVLARSALSECGGKNQNTAGFVGGLWFCFFLSSSRLCICPGQVIWSLFQFLGVIQVLN